ncbi:MAG: hypothetical protein H6617_06940 [Bdellovibrionaceae bacterium]|nr:hypothetical protein [Bdellovibrionales bacterium]MCB9254402.1 hypothetical protein [Pseudobdellovibrionaceae bacterium]
MLKNSFAVLGLSFLVLTALAFGAEGDSEVESVEAGELAAAVETPSTTDIYGSLDLRPSVYPNSASPTGAGAGLENTLEAGVKIGANTKIGYVQVFNANFSNSPLTGGSDLEAGDGWFKASFANLWVSEDGNTNFSYQPRVYLPTAPAARDAGMITTVRNYLTLSTKYSDSFSLATSLVPIVHFFDRSGNGAKPNKAFETRLYVIPTFNFTERLSLSVPVMAHYNLSRSHGGVQNNTFVLWTWPELLYSLDNTNTVGVAYYSGNFLKGAAGSQTLDFGNGFGNESAFQVVYQASL